MTLSTIINKNEYDANGSTTIFSYAFPILDEDHMYVYLDGVLQASGYTVDGVGEASGGDVTFDTAPADGTRVSLYRVVPLKQLVDYLAFDKFPSATHEAALDYLTMLCQQLAEEIERAIRAPIGADPGTDYTLPLYDGGKAIMWDESSQALTNSDDEVNGILSGATAAKDAAVVAQGAAETAETNAEAAEAKAEQWAEEDEDVEVEPGKFSSKHWAAKAESEGSYTRTESDARFVRDSVESEWTAAQRYTQTDKTGNGTVTIDASSENFVYISLSGNTTIAALSNQANGRCGMIRIRQTGGYTVSFASGWLFDNNVVPDIDSDANSQLWIAWMCFSGYIYANVFHRRDL